MREARERRIARLARCWRIVRTVSAFGVFGVCGLLLGTTLTALRLFDRDGARSQARAQRAIHRGYRAFVWFLEAMGLFRVHVHDARRLSGPGARLVVANHPTLLDVVFLIAQMPQADCVVNTARARNPFLRSAVSAAGYVRNDEGPAVVEECARRLRAGRTVLLFPEGTRSPVHGLRPFRRGAAHIALESGCPMTPVRITSDPPALTKEQRWYDLPRSPVELSLRVQEPISPRPYLESGETRVIAARKLTGELRESIVKGLDLG